MLNKILDPNSVVREGEFDRVAQAQGVFQRAGLALQKLQSGATLSPQLAADIRNVAEFYNNASQARMDRIAQDYSERAGRRGLDARNVVGIYAPKPPGAAAASSNVDERKHSYYHARCQALNNISARCDKRRRPATRKPPRRSRRTWRRWCAPRL